MDWAKAKTILIVVFLILNIFLLSTNLYINSTVGFQSDYKQYATKYLQSRDIKIETKIVDVTEQIGKLSYTEKDFDFKKLTRYIFGHELSQSTTGSAIVFAESDAKIELVGEELNVSKKLSDSSALFQNPEAFLKKAYSFLEDIGYSKKNIIFQSSVDSENEMSLIFNLKYKNAVLYDQLIKIRLDRDGLLSVTLPAREVKRINAPADILSVYQILVMGKLPDGSIIKSVNLGYKQISEDEKYDTPVWCVILTDGTVYFYNVYSGEKL